MSYRAATWLSILWALLWLAAARALLLTLGPALAA